ncbi:MAG: S8 family serine peptidase, partial [Candidatus Neomarinimicrobiota bacterium]
MRPVQVLIWAAVVIWAASTQTYGQQRILPLRLPELRELSAYFHQRYEAQHREAEKLAAASRLAVRLVLPDGRQAALQRFSRGQPFYYITTNLNAARTVGTDRVWPGGGPGLALTGAQLTLAVWDDAGIRTTHQEFGNRIAPIDGWTSISDHATHVAGTIIAAGVVAAARGMAYEANVHSYDWYDNLAEIASAAVDGLALSNHSYCIVRGWQWNWHGDGKWAWFGDEAVSATEDYLFGFYDSTASDWDQIAVNAPAYLIVTAAGNDRADAGPEPGESHWVWDGSQWVLSTEARNHDGDYDCLPGGAQVAKNVLVVGAVQDIPDGYADTTDVVMTSFSSWGPTDDGRIKPDLVANGMELYSTLASSDTDYGSFSGTSMAAPSVTGSVALLQQHYQQTHNGSFPLAATLKALLIHTADEAGSTRGPDYIHGWGLLNTAAAATLISRDTATQRTIQELTLHEGEVHSAALTCDGTEPLMVTISWSDPPGTVPAAQLDPETPALINDLDLRLTRAIDGWSFYPWRLAVESPTAAAVQADNSVDNVEQILISTPDPGEYTITVDHKHTLLAGTQDFSMVITGASFPQQHHVLVWEGDSAGVDYSGTYIRDLLLNTDSLEVTYTTTFPASLEGYDAVFLSFGPPGSVSIRTKFVDSMAIIVQGYLESGGSLYLEGGDALGTDQKDNPALLALLGIEAAIDGYGAPNPIDELEGQSQAITSGMSFNSSNQVNTTYLDSFVIGSGTAAFVE